MGLSHNYQSYGEKLVSTVDLAQKNVDIFEPVSVVRTNGLQLYYYFSNHIVKNSRFKIFFCLFVFLFVCGKYLKFQYA